jgi:hypothetical protein
MTLMKINQCLDPENDNIDVSEEEFEIYLDDPEPGTGMPLGNE